ncbi:hypothetical protein FNF28_05041 [Cafeteria roenbergensis]|uniref:Peroxin-5 n=1 Tax=Cafeteria roenbergensis TaxID=33653 RepID=A0A5A8D9B8_CAFRO|nr:hypothetical protein FNF28_05041 [Cafeteria roenbergensis]
MARIAAGRVTLSADGSSLQGDVPVMEVASADHTGAPLADAVEESLQAGRHASGSADPEGAAAAYSFTRDADSNPFLGGSARELAGVASAVPEDGLGPDTALEVGRRLFDAGRIQEATLALEAAVRRDPGLSEAWRLLGNCAAETEDDARAIACLEQAVAADPYNVRALLALGCSLVNELRESSALAVLRDWVRHNPSFSHLDDLGLDQEEETGGAGASRGGEAAAAAAASRGADGAELEGDLYGDGSEMDRVSELMLRVQREAPSDPDVASVLGLLYNISRDWDAAAAQLKRALQAKPAPDPTPGASPHVLAAASAAVAATMGDDTAGPAAGSAGPSMLQGVPRYVTLNRLAATLANGSRHLEALPLYEQALSLRPGYARAMHNQGVALSALGRHEEAARSFVRALRQNVDAPHVWQRLRMTLFSWDSDARLGGQVGGSPGAGDAPGAGDEAEQERRARLIGLAYDRDVEALAAELGMSSASA